MRSYLSSGEATLIFEDEGTIRVIHKTCGENGRLREQNLQSSVATTDETGNSLALPTRVWDCCLPHIIPEIYAEETILHFHPCDHIELLLSTVSLKIGL